MYEKYTYEFLLNRALGRIKSDVDKRQGSVVYDALAPACAELAQAYIELDRISKEIFADTATRAYLIKRAKERGIKPDEATYSIVLAELIGDINLKGNERFNLDSLNFAYTGEMYEDFYKLVCETTGKVGNVTYGDLIPIDNISGLRSAKIIDVFYAARDDEDTEEFRSRYFESFNVQAFGGNRADYKTKIMALNAETEIVTSGGIGACKIIRAKEATEHGGIVTVIIADSTLSSPKDAKLLKLIKEKIDPEDSESDGAGFAPIGHKVKVLGAETEKIKIEAELIYKDGYSWNEVSEQVLSAVDSYLLEVNKTWADNSTLEISRIQLGADILAVKGIARVTDVYINNRNEDYTVKNNKVVARGEFIVS